METTTEVAARTGLFRLLFRFQGALLGMDLCHFGTKSVFRAESHCNTSLSDFQLEEAIPTETYVTTTRCRDFFPRFKRM